VGLQPPDDVLRQPDLTVTVDGEKVAENLKFAAGENKAAVSSKGLSSGAHKFEAKDASGKVIETLTWEVKSGSNGMIFAPGRNPKICFFVQTDEYKTNAAAPDTVKDRYKPLDPTKNIWDIPESIDYWFQDSPNDIKVDSKKTGNVIKRAIRQGACDDPNFQG
jgi:hypothetical protein